eukprot:m.75641 g.75641  ORF g.75641 m.75641 type:complete len:105 (+) comp13990_c0_seq5:491-805(+)
MGDSSTKLIGSTMVNSVYQRKKRIHVIRILRFDSHKHRNRIRRDTTMAAFQHPVNTPDDSCSALKVQHDGLQIATTDTYQIVGGLQSALLYLLCTNQKLQLPAR